MLIKRFLVASLALLFVCAMAASSYAATSKELCAASAKEFQKINRLKGYFPEELSDADYETIRSAGANIKANEEARIKDANIDANTKALSQSVAIHAGHIAERAKGDKVGLIEDVGHSYRFLFLSCRSCHQIYQTEAGLAP
ncbi:MAG: hypothetical protein NOU37_07230 [Candidatus Brocadiales bacterium]|nr:hypothetical protein [Candidatus Bathyanammoxibius sp.]MCQ4575018.1 hypothetical protein [Candidatus Bathyanammoxibius amoris]